MVVAAIPAIRLASKSLQVALTAGFNFASHLGETSDSRPLIDPSPPESNSRTDPLDRLVSRLQQYLKSIDVPEHSGIELRTDSRGGIAIEGEPGLKQAVEQWLTENREWAEAWRAAARSYLAESPTLGLSPLDPSSNMPPTSLRSQIRTRSAQHWYQAH